MIPTNPNASLNHNQMTQHPKSIKNLIWDTFAPLKPPQIEKTSNLGYIFPFKTTPNRENEQFGIHLPLQKHPKLSKREIWDTFAPINATPNYKSRPFGINSPPTKKSQFSPVWDVRQATTHKPPHSVEPVSTVRCLILFVAKYTMSLSQEKHANS